MSGVAPAIDPAGHHVAVAPKAAPLGTALPTAASGGADTTKVEQHEKTHGTATPMSTGAGDNTTLAGSTASPVKAHPSEEGLSDEERERIAGMPKGLRLYLIMLGMFMAVFVVSLDQTIVGPAIPVISNAFSSLSDVGWYGSAYLATATALQPLYGRLYRINLKWPYISCMVVFEIGSLICALAQDSKTFIVGRAIAGVGVAGGYIGTLTIIAASVPLNKVPMWAGGVGAVYGIGAICGPLIGGVFTSEVTWRWAFWISLPLGGVTILTVLVFFHPPPRTKKGDFNLLKTVWSLDLGGTALVLAGLVCFLLALQDGGLKYAWSSGREIGLLVAAGVIVILFFINEYFMRENAIIPLRIQTSRTISLTSIANIGIGASYFVACIFVPIYFQLRGSSAIRSGVQMLPLICGVIFSVTVSGAMVPKTGYVQPYLIVGSVLAFVGSGTWQLWTESSSQAMWVGTSFLYGLGIGTIWQMPFNLSQTWGHGKGLDTEVGASITIFWQTMGGALFVAIAQSIYANTFAKEVLAVASQLPAGVDVNTVIASGTTAWREFVPTEAVPIILAAAMTSIRKVFIAVTVVLATTLLATLGMPWASIKGQAPSVGGA